MLKDVELRDYQKRILEELKCVPAIGLFMKTGSGKTLTSLERVLQNGTKNLLIICPQKIITQWWEVLEKHTDFIPLKYKLNMTAKDKNELFENYLKANGNSCVVVNFDILDKVKSIDKFIDNTWTIIIDESHKIKNIGTRKSPVKTTKRTKKATYFIKTGIHTR